MMDFSRPGDSCGSGRAAQETYQEAAARETRSLSTKAAALKASQAAAAKGPKGRDSDKVALEPSQAAAAREHGSHDSDKAAWELHWAQWQLLESSGATAVMKQPGGCSGLCVRLGHGISPMSLMGPHLYLL